MTTITTEANLTADPQLRYTATTAQPVANLRLAVSARRKNLDGVYEDTPAVFYDATVWGPLAEHAAESLIKGDRVLVHGSVWDEEWTDREGGTRVRHVLSVESIGASLRYATARLTRVNRSGNNGVQQDNSTAGQPAG
jgi:single-strand DNA-binding protein